MKTSTPVTPQSNEIVLSGACSPLSPLKTRLRLLQFLGWPLKITNDEATEVRKRPWSILVLICYLAALILLAVVWILLAFTSMSYTEMRAMWYQQFSHGWEQNSLMVLMVPNMFFGPIMFYYSYRGMDQKMTAFLNVYTQIAGILQGK